MDTGRIADYTIDVKLDDDKQSIQGFETITYTNNSPDDLNYLWVQLDQNVRAKDSDSYKIYTGSMRNKIDFSWVKPGYVIGDQDANEILNKFDGGFKIEEVVTIDGRKLEYVINKTMMRIDLKKPLKSKSKPLSLLGGAIIFKIEFLWVVAQDMNFLRLTATTFILFVSGFLEWQSTTMFMVGKINNFWVEVSSHLTLEIMMFE